MAVIDRVHTRLDRSELERRWAIARQRLKDLGADALVMLNSEDFLGAYVRWFTDIPTVYAYHTGLIFHADDRMSLIAHGAIGGHLTFPGDNPDYPGIGEVFQTASFHSAMQTWRYEAEIVVECLKRRGYRRVALAGTGAMPHGFVLGLTEAAPAEFIDDTDFFDRAKAIKSAAEIEQIRAVAAVQDRIFAEVLPQIRPGLRDQDIAALCQLASRREGGEQGVFLAGSAPPSEPAFMRFPHLQGREIAPGDQVTILIENNGPTGYYTELGRTVVLGKASAAHQDAFALAVEAQAATVSRLRPGGDCAEIARAHDSFLAGHGLPPERRVYSHGQGYALVERPLIRFDETMTLAAGMSITVHPNFVKGGAFGYLCDNYIVSEDGAARPVHQTAKRIFELS